MLELFAGFVLAIIVALAVVEIAKWLAVRITKRYGTDEEEQDA